MIQVLTNHVSSTIPPRSGRIASIQRWALVLLIAGGALNYIDRATLSVANQSIQNELRIPVEKMGLLISAFLWTYAFAQLPVGGLIDRFGPRKLLGLGLLGWSAAQAAGGFVYSFGPFAAARAALGIGEAPLFPGGARVVRDWFNIQRRGIATGVCQAAGSLGNFIALPVLTYLMVTWSWRWMFIIVGAAGVVLAIVWWMIHRDPREVALTDAERHYLTEGDENSSTQPPSFADWRSLFAHRTTWGMIAGFFGNIYTLWLYNGWLPFYLEHERHMSVKTVGFVASVPFLCGCIGAVVGGWLCDFLTRRGWEPIRARKMLISSALVATSLCTLGNAYAGSDGAVIAFVSGSLFLIYIASSASWATVPIAAPSQFTGSLGSIQNFGGYLGGALAPVVTGYILKSTGNFRPALLLCAAISLTSACSYLLLVRGPIRMK